MEPKEEFLALYREHITRPGSQELLDYLLHKSDFFTAPASTRFHGNYPGGLCEHSLHVYHCLTDYLSRPRAQELYRMGNYTPETVAIVALLHDICKVNCYKQSTRNVKDKQGNCSRSPGTNLRTTCPTATGRKACTSSPGICG